MPKRSVYQEAVSTKAKRDAIAADIEVFAGQVGLACEIEQVDARCTRVHLRLAHYRATVDLDGSMPIDCFTVDWNIEYPTLEACHEKSLPLFPANFGRYCLEPGEYRAMDRETNKATTVVADRRALMGGLLGGFRRLRPIVQALTVPETSKAA